MLRIGSVYRILNVLSVDVAFGAVCCALFFAKILQVQILSYGLISLWLTVWIIYTTDHLLDARKLQTTASTERHRFHQKHFQEVLKFLGGALLLDFMIVLFIRERVLVGGIFLGTGVIMYLIIQRYVRFLKEISIALLYTSGVLLPSIMVTPISIATLPWIVIIQFTLVALLNLLIFSWFDHDHDLHDGTTSVPIFFGKKATSIFIWVLFFTICLLSLLSTNPLASCFILVMGLVLIIIFLRSKYFLVSDRFRFVGDGVFFIPGLYLLL